ncbi:MULTISPECIES: hypothetical protein [Streptomyces]|uniref:hypothetical protein n=1 Tax=Streptomyces TaxID=1883 RepID=UPI00165EE591|nr:hypothetical protein [Streptomyces apricus]
MPEHEAGGVPTRVREIPGHARVPVARPGGPSGRNTPHRAVRPAPSAPAVTAVKTRGTGRSARPVRDGTAVAVPAPTPSDRTP